MNFLDKDTFEQWMGRIMERFDRSDKIIATLANKKINTIDGEELLDNFDLCAMMHVSKRTLQRYRSSGLLPYQMILHKTYYKQSDVQTFMREHFERFLKKNSKRPKRLK